MFLDNIKNIGNDAVKQIENEIAKAKKSNEPVEPAEIKLRGRYGDCHIIITINLFYGENPND